MDDERKYKISSMVGTTVLFGSCIGMSYYNDEEPEGYESIHEKLSMDTIITSSLITGIVLAIVTWLLLTYWDCLKKAKEKEDATTWDLFKKDVFCKETLWTFAILIVVSVLMVFLGMAFIGLAIFFLPLLKGRFK